MARTCRGRLGEWFRAQSFARWSSVWDSKRRAPHRWDETGNREAKSLVPYLLNYACCWNYLEEEEWRQKTGRPLITKTMKTSLKDQWYNLLLLYKRRALKQTNYHVKYLQQAHDTHTHTHTERERERERPWEGIGWRAKERERERGMLDKPLVL